MSYKQRGAAAIYLVLLLIPLFGTVFLALEGTRFIQKQNRLADASEAAALAITIANRENKTNYEKEMSTRYVQSYIRDINNTPVLSVSVKKGEDSVNGVIKSYVQYKVDATTTHKSWFSSLLIPSFKPTESIANKAVARNYPETPGDKFIDLVFVADFSGSMNWPWGNTRRKKIDVLKDAVVDISKGILEQAPNKIAMVPFDYYTARKIGNRIECENKLKKTPGSSAFDYAASVNTVFKGSSNSGSCNHFPFRTIEMTNDIKKISLITAMNSRGSGTAAFQGVMKAAELLYKEKHKPRPPQEQEEYKKRLKMILILSDGADSQPEHFRQLVSAGLCRKIKREFSRDGEIFYMAFLGIDFDASGQNSFERCVGKGNIIDVENVNELVLKIKEIMKKGAKTEGISKLHYRHLS